MVAAIRVKHQIFRYLNWPQSMILLTTPHLFNLFVQSISTPIQHDLQTIVLQRFGCLPCHGFPHWTGNFILISWLSQRYMELTEFTCIECWAQQQSQYWCSILQWKMGASWWDGELMLDYGRQSHVIDDWLNSDKGSPSNSHRFLSCLQRLGLGLVTTRVLPRAV